MNHSLLLLAKTATYKKAKRVQIIAKTDAGTDARTAATAAHDLADGARWQP